MQIWPETHVCTQTKCRSLLPWFVQMGSFGNLVGVSSQNILSIILSQEFPACCKLINTCSPKMGCRLRCVSDRLYILSYRSLQVALMCPQYLGGCRRSLIASRTMPCSVLWPPSLPPPDPLKLSHFPPPPPPPPPPHLNLWYGR